MRKFSTIDEVLEDTTRASVNRVKLIEEVGDVLCMIELMVEHGVLTNDELGARITLKRDKLKTWSNLIK